jgi:hypothetical protein
MRGQGMPMAGETGSVAKRVDGIKVDWASAISLRQNDIRVSSGRRFDRFPALW